MVQCLQAAEQSKHPGTVEWKPSDGIAFQHQHFQPFTILQWSEGFDATNLQPHVGTEYQRSV